MRSAVFVFAGLLACSSPATVPLDAAREIDAGAPDSGEDAGVDRGVSVEVPLLAPPVARSEVASLGESNTLDLSSAFDVSSDGSVTVVWDSFDVDFTEGALYTSRSPDGVAFAAAERLSGSDGARYEANPSFLDGRLYFWAASDLRGASSLVERETGAARSLAGVSSLLSWPKLYAWGDKVAAAFRDVASVPRFVSGESLDTLGDSVAVAEPGALATLGLFADGSLAYTYQFPVGAEPMVSFVRRSSDGAEWSEAVRVSDASSNVHDTTMVPRDDGGLDLYYIQTTPTSRGFVLYRRSLTSEGVLGMPEALSTERDWEPSKPQGVRLPSGEVLVGVANIATRAPSGIPARQEFLLFRLSSDAP
ncbi:MAG: hypothetical protein AAGE52_23800 [Myxococcota bacterium]